uniref:Uncharacterized protein n=1 Tax=Anguilla anguilla TaxID=7936 RepID=A0A0E9SVD5_ANGAN
MSANGSVFASVSASISEYLSLCVPIQKQRLKPCVVCTSVGNFV